MANLKSNFDHIQRLHKKSAAYRSGHAYDEYFPLGQIGRFGIEANHLKTTLKRVYFYINCWSSISFELYKKYCFQSKQYML